MASATFAQRKTVTEDWGQDPASEIYIPACALPGRITYSYIIGEEGDVQKDGPLSIKCSVVNETTYISPYTITINGSYTLNATYSKGNLNGPFSSNYKTTLDGYIIVSKDAVNVGSTMTGNFANGVPNGAFKVTRKGDFPTTLTANFKNGKLVGAFSCSMTDEDSYRQKYSGTLTQTGKPTGVWKVNDGRTTIGELTREFSNGVLISEVSKKKATKPAISALARKYANGELTEEQLFEQGCVIRTAKMELGDFVRIAILRDAAVDFKTLGGYDFSEPNHIEYKWLKETATMTDAGVQELVRGIRQFIIEDWRSILGNMLSSSEYDEGIKYGCIETDERGKMYVQMGKWQNNGYAKGGFEEHEDNVYLSPKQSEYVEQQAYQAILESVCSLQDLAVVYYKDVHSGDKARFCEDYFKAGKTPADFKTAKEVEEAKNILAEVYKECVEGGTLILPMDANITAVPYGDRKIKYVHTESIAEYKKMLDELDNIIIEVATRVIRESVAKVFDYMVAERTAFGICYGESENYFYSTSGYEYWRSELESALKKFGRQFVGYEIISIGDTTAECKLTFLDKKKVAGTWQITIEHKDGKLCVESFDINKATKLEE